MTSDINEQSASAAAAAATQNANQHNKKSGAGDAAELFSKMLDSFRAHGLVEIDGGEGDDIINGEGYRVRISGGDGNDTITANGFDVKVDGGAGDDVINARGYGHVPTNGQPHHDLHGHMGHFHHHHLLHVHSIPAVQTSGGAGDDTINSAGFSNAKGGSGDDIINIGGGLALGGSGDDTITSTGGSASLHGGTGNDTIVSRGMININSNISGGAGDDDIYASGSHIFIQGGTGEDTITLDGTDDRGVQFIDRFGHVGTNHALRSNIEGGIGDDVISLVKDAKATIGYFKGDGHDTLQGARETSAIRFGPGLTFEAATFSSSGNDLTIAFADTDGSITIQNYADKGVPMMEFAGGRVLDASTTIALAGGDPGAYKADDGGVTSNKSEASSHDDD